MSTVSLFNNQFDNENFIVFKIYNNQSFMIKIGVVGTFLRFFKA